MTAGGAIVLGTSNVTIERAKKRQIQLASHELAQRIAQKLYYEALRRGEPVPTVSDIFVRGAFTVIELDPASIGSRAQQNRVLDPTRLSLYSGDGVDRPVWGLRRFPKHSATSLSDGTWLVTSWMDEAERRRNTESLPPQQQATTIGAETTISIRAGFDVSTIPSGQYVFPMGQHADGPAWFESMLDTLHLMVIGESGSGKSNFLKGILYALTSCNTTDQLRIAWCSAKASQFSMFYHLPHIWKTDKWDGRVATTADDVTTLVELLMLEFNRRDREFSRIGVDNLEDYTRETGKTFPRLLFMADELLTIAMMTGGAERKGMMGRLASLLNVGRSHGFHLMLAITKPHFETVPTAITWNIDNRIAFRVATAEVSDRFECFGAHLIPKDAVGQFVARINGKVSSGRAYLVTNDNVALDRQAKPISAPVHSLDQVVLGDSPATDSEPEQVEITPRIAALVVFAVDRLGRRFTSNRLFDTFRDDGWKACEIKALAARLHQAGQLEYEDGGRRGRAGARVVTDALESAARSVLASTQADMPAMPSRARG